MATVILEVIPTATVAIHTETDTATGTLTTRPTAPELWFMSRRDIIGIITVVLITGTIIIDKASECQLD